ncbi:cupin domain-containing protein [Actinoplanes sp. KI2]|uniref:(R)-mandelonitrile lyase n=1 Tax=Actinoplanes sp. KI2 TaxID=2983315 RepID=UPI0021D60557|nr:cupin domain-containing protein [Actinoplanes sp. KI2]MCU7723867.1 cupin domain-containing protein [Actinoplanes sp. KI2]
MRTSMELLPVRPTRKGPASAFTGDVYVTPICVGTGPSRMSVSLVRFTPGAHTNWHHHAVGQTLHVTEGVGLVGTRDGTVLRIHAGETIVCPPGEDHWHGAAPDTFMSHLAMLETKPDGGDPTTWLEPVTDQHYEQADNKTRRH